MLHFHEGERLGDAFLVELPGFSEGNELLTVPHTDEVIAVPAHRQLVVYGGALVPEVIDAEIVLPVGIYGRYMIVGSGDLLLTDRAVALQAAVGVQKAPRMLRPVETVRTVEESSVPAVQGGVLMKDVVSEQLPPAIGIRLPLVVEQ